MRALLGAADDGPCVFRSDFTRTNGLRDISSVECIIDRKSKSIRPIHNFFCGVCNVRRLNRLDVGRDLAGQDGRQAIAIFFRVRAPGHQEAVAALEPSRL